MNVCAKAGCLWPLAKVGEKCDMSCCEGTVISNNIQILSVAGDNVVE